MTKGERKDGLLEAETLPPCLVEEPTYWYKLVTSSHVYGLNVKNMVFILEGEKSTVYKEKDFRCPAEKAQGIVEMTSVATCAWWP